MTPELDAARDTVKQAICQDILLPIVEGFNALSIIVSAIETDAKTIAVYKAALENIGRYYGEGPMARVGTWRDIVRDLGICARAALAKGKE